MQQMDLVEYISENNVKEIKTNKKVSMLKEAGEDFEWYPTTLEIMDSLKQDLISSTLMAEKMINDYRSYNLAEKISEAKSNNDFNSVFANKSGSYRSRGSFGLYNNERCYLEEKDVKRLEIDSLLEIGAGDGRVINYLQDEKSNKKEGTYIKEVFAIEKSNIQADELVKKGYSVIGRDYMQTFLADKYFSVVYCNPPYSDFKNWLSKTLSEINATVIYFTIPQRWKDDEALMQFIKDKFAYKVVGSYDFSEGDREARAKVDLVKFTSYSKTSSFDDWIENNIGGFKKNEEIEIEEFNKEEELSKSLKERKGGLADILVEAYEKDMQELIETYQTIGKIPFHILEQLDISKSKVFNKIKSDINSLKVKYWQKSFDLLTEITSRLTYKKRSEILGKITWINELDFNQYNIRTIIVWVIENYEKFTNEELVSLFESFTSDKNITAYKSNRHWNKDTWRYAEWGDGKGKPEKYSLDYRIVTYMAVSRYDWETRKGDNLIKDLEVIAGKLGFNPELDLSGYNEGGFSDLIDFTIKDYSVKKSYTDETLKTKDKTLFEYRVYQNGNVHFKLHKDLLMKINIEVAKIKKWVKSPEDIQEEFNISLEESNKLFGEKPLSLGNIQNKLLLLS